MRKALTALGRTKVLARSGGTRASATGLFNAKSAAFMEQAMKSLASGISLFRSDHLNETESTRISAVRITHDVGLLNLAVLFEKLGHILF